jgi:hypothetical protein
MSVAYVLAFAAAAASQPDDLSIQAVHNFGACVVAQTPQGAREALALDYRTAEYQRKLRAVGKGHGRCVTPWGLLRSSRLLVAGAMAEALLKTDVREAELAKRLAFDAARPPIEARDATEAMALCSVLHGSAATADLLGTEPTSPEEKRAEEALTPILKQCLASNTELRLNRPALRSLLALAAWRIVSTSGSPAT